MTTRRRLILATFGAATLLGLGGFAVHAGALPGGLPLANVVLAMAGLCTIGALVVVRRRSSARRRAARQ